MRHGKKFNHLGRTSAHRKALMKNQAKALIEHKRIRTTLAKAKSLRRYIEPLVTKAKNDTTHNRRVVFSYLQDKESIKELFGTIAEAVGDRPGGYTRVIKLGFRKTDGAELALIEFVDFNEDYQPMKKEAKSGGSRRRRRNRKGGQSTESLTSTVEETIDEGVEVVEDQVDEIVEEVTDAAEDVTTTDTSTEDTGETIEEKKEG